MEHGPSRMDPAACVVLASHTYGSLGRLSVACSCGDVHRQRDRLAWLQLEAVHRGSNVAITEGHVGMVTLRGSVQMK